MKMALLISRIILTLIFGYLIFKVWTKNVDILLWVDNKINTYFPSEVVSSEGFTLDFEYDRISVSFFRSRNNKKIDGKMAIFFYHTAIVNRNDVSSTIKDIKASIEIGNKKQTLNLYNVKTGILKSGSKALALMFGKQKSLLFISGWENIQPIIDQRKVLLPGEVLSGSLMFPIDRFWFDEEAKTINNIKIIISDFYGKISVQDIKIDSTKFKIMDNNVFINDNTFIQNEDETIKWGD